VILRGRSLALTGAISANGQAGTSCVSPGGAGGGGAGGSILLSLLNSASLGNNLATATGGSGGLVTGDPTNEHFRRGGSGGEGRIKVNGVTITGSTNPAYN
jgi:hypothetical protein